MKFTVEHWAFIHEGRHLVTKEPVTIEYSYDGRSGKVMATEGGLVRCWQAKDLQEAIYKTLCSLANECDDRIVPVDEFYARHAGFKGGNYGQEE